ncbi:HNH endonuclease, partial [Micromonospora globbae]
GYYAANRSRILDYKKQYNANNKEKVREWWRKREALKREALYLGHTVEDLEQKLAFYGGKCWICKTNPHEHWDHVKPLSKGGAHILANLRPSCASCNRSKRDRWPFVPEMILDNQRAYALAT